MNLPAPNLAVLVHCAKGKVTLLIGYLGHVTSLITLSNGLSILVIVKVLILIVAYKPSTFWPTLSYLLSSSL